MKEELHDIKQQLWEANKALEQKNTEVMVLTERGNTEYFRANEKVNVEAHTVNITSTDIFGLL